MNAPASTTSLAPSRPVGIVAGEASGDLLGSLLVQALQEEGLADSFEGIAGPRMQTRGARSLHPMETLSVRGYVEALSNLRQILAIRRQLTSHFLLNPPRLFIGIDAPDFNLGLETRLRAAGIPTVHFVGPSVWAWRANRIHAIRKAVSHMLLIFPFEEAIYRDAGIPATYVGHPLAYALPEQINRLAARERLGLRPDGVYVALLPGSRQSELKHLAATYIETAKTMHGKHPELRFLVPLVSRETRALFQQALHDAGADELPVRLLFGHAHDTFQAADVALVASGTATLEAALLDCPHIITYKVPWLTYQIMKRQGRIPYIGLPNILAERFLVPEILQDKATPEALAEALLALLADPGSRRAMQSGFADIRRQLRRDTPRLIAQALRPFLS